MDPLDRLLADYLELPMVPPTDDRASKPELEQAREHGEILARLKANEASLEDGKSTFKELRRELGELKSAVAVIQSQWGSHSALIARYVAPILVVLIVEAFKTYVLKR